MTTKSGERIAELTTARCVLRPVRFDDAERLHRLWSSPGVRRYLWDGAEIPFTRTMAAIDQSERLFAERNYGLWCVWSIDSSELAGFGGLWPFRDPPDIELVYGVAEPLWGAGYATEIARAVVGYCFDELDMLAVNASTDTGNLASVRVLEKVGFTFVRQDIVGGVHTLFYELKG